MTDRSPAPGSVPVPELVPAGDVAFAEPWQARLFAAAVVTCDRLSRPWDDFRDQLKAAVAEEPDRPYFESFTLALERLVRSTDGVGS